MPLEKKECPSNCNEASCDKIHEYFAAKWLQCGGDSTCEAEVEELYHQSLETCSVPQNA